jgi:hypothetical protein
VGYLLGEDREAFLWAFREPQDSLCRGDQVSASSESLATEERQIKGRIFGREVIVAVTGLI